MNTQAQVTDFDQRIADKINLVPGMKLSVVWRMADSAINELAQEIKPYNAALSKTLPMLKKKGLARDFEGVIDGKYIKFPDGSQAKY
jgi:hypothetical protein